MRFVEDASMKSLAKLISSADVGWPVHAAGARARVTPFIVEKESWQAGSRKMIQNDSFSKGQFFPPIWGVKFVEKLGFPNIFGSGKKT